MNVRSLGFRLAVWYFCTVTAILSLAVTGYWFAVRAGLHAAMDRRLGYRVTGFQQYLEAADADEDDEIASRLAAISRIGELYLVNTHHHFDHAGGLRTLVAEGAGIVTHQMNREFYEKVVFSPAPRTLAPDRLYVLNPDVLRDPVFELVNQKYVISDGTRTLDVYPVPAFDHASSMVFAYLPRERLAVNADMYTPPKPGAPLPKPSASTRMLLQTIQHLGLDIAQHVGLHGGVGPHEDLIKIVGQPATN